MTKHFTAVLLLAFAGNCLADAHQIEIELPKIKAGDYQRPYVAVWVANHKNQSQKVLQLWHERERWLKDLKYFWRRVLRKEPNSVDGVTGATRGPGSYRIDWNGEGKQGLLPPGNYKLCAEVAREHGGHTAKCLKFQLPLAQAEELVLDGEFSKLRIEAK